MLNNKEGVRLVAICANAISSSFPIMIPAAGDSINWLNFPGKKQTYHYSDLYWPGPHPPWSQWKSEIWRCLFFCWKNYVSWFSRSCGAISLFLLHYAPQIAFGIFGNVWKFLGHFSKFWKILGKPNPKFWKMSQKIPNFFFKIKFLHEK